MTALVVSVVPAVAAVGMAPAGSTGVVTEGSATRDRARRHREQTTRAVDRRGGRCNAPREKMRRSQIHTPPQEPIRLAGQGSRWAIMYRRRADFLTTLEQIDNAGTPRS